MAHTGRPGWSGRVVAGALVLGVALAGLVARHGSARGAFSVAPPPAATMDARLIIRPRTVAVQGTLSKGMRVVGTLFPDYPGPNTVRLVVTGSSGRGARWINLTVTMPGMAMPPVRARMAARDGRSSAVLALPMFGVYRMEVAVRTQGRPATGVVTLTLPLGQ